MLHRHSVPAPVLAAAAACLTDLPALRGEQFTLRLQRWYGDLVAGLEALWPDRDVTEIAQRLVVCAATAYGQRDPELHRVDEARLLEPDWLQQPTVFGYACYADRFGETLKGVADRIDYLDELGVTYLHLMPLLHPRDGDNDGGYAVADYRTVRPDLGTIDDVRSLATELRHHGISLVLDLVLNHVAREHEWAVAARAGDQRYREYFHVFPDRTGPDAYERTLPEVFPDFAPGNFTFDAELDGWVWTTFNEWQWDVNWSNPEVLLEYAEIILFLANLGVEVLRLDAIAFTWKRLGTSCQNQPEVHALTQVLRTVARLACPGLVFKAEAIVGPKDLVQYFGLGERAGKVSDLAYHNSLMVQIWSMLATGEVALATQALGALPATPTTSTWVCYARCHDDIGWAIDDSDAAAIGIGGWSHRAFLADWYAGTFPGSPARGLVFQHNELTGDRRISGTTAALCGLESAATAVDEGLALGRIFLVHAIVAGWGGVPVIWSGDELGLVNDREWASEPGHGDDNRWAHRPRLDWQRAEDRHDLRTHAGKVFQGISHLGAVRAGLPQLHASAHSEILRNTDPGVLATSRQHPSGAFVGLYNVTSTWRSFPIWRLVEAGVAAPYDALSGHDVQAGADGLIWLGPYAARWVIDRPATARDGR
jgi:amylosucrase